MSLYVLVFTCPAISVGSILSTYEYIIGHFGCVFILGELILQRYAQRFNTLCGISRNFCVVSNMIWHDGLSYAWNQTPMPFDSINMELFSAAHWPILMLYVSNVSIFICMLLFVLYTRLSIFREN